MSTESERFAQRASRCAPWEFEILFDGPPGPEAGRFIEVEDASGASMSIGRWEQRAGGTWALVMPDPRKLAQTVEAQGDFIKAVENVLGHYKKQTRHSLKLSQYLSPFMSDIDKALVTMRRKLGGR